MSELGVLVQVVLISSSTNPIGAAWTAPTVYRGMVSHQSELTGISSFCVIAPLTPGLRQEYDNCKTMRNTKRKKIGAAGSKRKERVTITLSRHSAEYVRNISAQEQSHVSTVIERMIEAARRAQELKQLEAEISAFYDARPDSLVQEDAPWGQVGAAGLAALVESKADEILPARAPRDSAR
jgi:hypothetical protein